MSHVIQRTITGPGQLPSSFFQLKKRLFDRAGLVVEESPGHIEELLKFQYEKAAIELFMIEGKARVLGIHPTGGDVALFGFWETENDSVQNANLFAALEIWAIQRGCMRIEGPKNFNTFHANRIRTSNAPWNQFNNEPINPLYCQKLLMEIGYSESINYSSRLLNTEVIPKAYVDKKELIEGLKELSFDFISLNRESWKNYRLEIFELVCDVFGLNPGFQTIDFAEFELIYNAEFAEMLCPNTSVLLAERGTGKLVGISLCYPNYLPLKLNERPIYEKHYPLLKHRTLLAKTQGIHPDYRQQGLMNFLGAYGMLSFKRYYDDIIFCLMREGNPSLRFTEAFQYQEASYALFEKELLIT